MVVFLATMWWHAHLVSCKYVTIYKTILYICIPYSMDEELAHDVHPLAPDFQSTLQNLMNIPTEHGDRSSNGGVYRYTLDISKLVRELLW